MAIQNIGKMLTKEELEGFAKIFLKKIPNQKWLRLFALEIFFGLFS